MNLDSLTHPPEFIVKPRGQTVWEGKSVTLHCTVAGWPKPRVAWSETLQFQQYWIEMIIKPRFNLTPFCFPNFSGTKTMF